MNRIWTLLAIAGTLSIIPSTLQAAEPGQTPEKPTVILVHGAFADASSWNGVVSELRESGYPVIAAANPLRGVRSDGAGIRALVESIDGPVVLVGHSYGGPVISAAADGADNVRALVFVAAFAPEAGESIVKINTDHPGATLGDALAPPLSLPGGVQDLYIRQELFPAQFAADVPEASARLMAVTQRPLAQSALEEGAPGAAWRTIPNWSIYGDSDRNIAPAALAFMAERAGSRRTVVVRGGSHSIMVSHPEAVADLIEEAAESR